MNPLDEMTAPAFDEGRDVQVINKQIPVKIGPGSVIFEMVTPAGLLRTSSVVRVRVIT